MKKWEPSQQSLQLPRAEKMRASNFISLLISLALALSMASQCSAISSKGQRPGSTWKVTIFNYQIGGALYVHCKSKDDDLGEQVLHNVGDRFSWEFRENIWRTTLYWCSFRSQLGHASFEVFWPEKSEWLSRRCNFENCVWFAQNDGFYLENISGGTADLLHRWETNS